MLVFQLDASGASACCCNGVNRDQAGPVVEVLPEVVGALAEVDGRSICDEATGGQASKMATASPGKTERIEAATRCVIGRLKMPEANASEKSVGRIIGGWQAGVRF